MVYYVYVYESWDEQYAAMHVQALAARNLATMGPAKTEDIVESSCYTHIFIKEETHS